MTSNVRAVVFDVGNTLWFYTTAPDIDAIVRAQEERVSPLLAEWSIGLPDPLDAVLHDIWDAVGEADAAQRDRGTHREVDLPFIIRGALAVRGIPISEAQAHTWHRAAWVPVRMFGVQLYPDTLDVLRDVRSLGMKVGINTNRPCSSEMFAPDLADFGIAPYVDAFVCSGDTGFVKPHPSTFDLMLHKLAIARSDVVMVGDAASADMRGAKAAGMRTVWKLNGRYDPPPCTEADFVIHDLAELLTLPLFPAAARHPIAAESLTPHEDGNAERY